MKGLPGAVMTGRVASVLHVVTALAWAALLPGDSVLAYDTRARRFSVFDDAGRPVVRERQNGLHVDVNRQDVRIGDRVVLDAGWNVDHVDVRLALKYAVDREDIAKKIFLGHATPGNDNPIGPSVKYGIDPLIARHSVPPGSISW